MVLVVKNSSANAGDIGDEGSIPGSRVNIHTYIPYTYTGFPGGSDGKASACNVGDPGSISGSGRSPAEGNGNPLQYSCLGNSMD